MCSFFHYKKVQVYFFYFYELLVNFCLLFGCCFEDVVGESVVTEDLLLRAYMYYCQLLELFTSS